MSGHSNQLLRVLGLVFGLAVVVGSVVGQGILRAPGVVAQASESPAILIGLWLLGGMVAMIAALPFAELGSALPACGGPIRFVGRAFGPIARAMMSVTAILALIVANAAVAFVAGEFLVRLGVGGGEVAPGAIATGLLVIFFSVNALGTRESGGIQITLSALKGVVLVAMVVVLFVQPGAARNASASAEALPQGAFGLATALMLIWGAFAGWDNVVCYGEEVENPERQIPRALFGGIAAITALYVAVNLALLHVMTPQQLAGSEFAAADALGGLFGARLDTVMTMFGVLSTCALCSLGLMTCSRLIFASAREGLLPGVIARVTARGVPLRAMVFALLGAAAFLWSGTYLTLMSTSTVLAQGLISAVALSAWRLRQTEPDLPRPFRIPAFPAVMALVIALDLTMLTIFVWQDPPSAAIGFVLVGAAGLGYWLLARIRPARTSEGLS